MAFQVYNSGNKCYVKMQGGRVLANAKQPFEGIPLRSDISGDLPENESEICTEPPELEPAEPITPPENEKTETVADSENSEDGFWGFDY